MEVDMLEPVVLASCNVAHSSFSSIHSTHYRHNATYSHLNYSEILCK
jgi:hypothetical protein